MFKAVSCSAAEIDLVKSNSIGRARVIESVARADPPYVKRVQVEAYALPADSRITPLGSSSALPSGATLVEARIKLR